MRCSLDSRDEIGDLLRIQQLLQLYRISFAIVQFVQVMQTDRSSKLNEHVSPFPVPLSLSLVHLPYLVFDLRVIGEGFRRDQCSVPFMPSRLKDKLNVRSSHINEIVRVGGQMY